MRNEEGTYAEMVVPEIPVALPGSLNELYDEEYVREDNLFAKFSVIALDPDDE